MESSTTFTRRSTSDCFASSEVCVFLRRQPFLFPRQILLQHPYPGSYPVLQFYYEPLVILTPHSLFCFSACISPFKLSDFSAQYSDAFLRSASVVEEGSRLCTLYISKYSGSTR